MNSLPFTAINSGNFPLHTMITLHPQRWTNSLPAWTKELLTQNLKNQIKLFLVK